jgi:hypothetical protein
VSLFLKGEEIILREKDIKVHVNLGLNNDCWRGDIGREFRQGWGKGR